VTTRPVATRELERQQRIADEENARWQFLKERIIDGGHDAVALSTTDLGSLMSAVLYDDEVEAIVTIRGAEANEDLRMPLADLWRITDAGIEILDVRAPKPQPITYQASSATVADGHRHVSAMFDRRGIGALVLSDAPDPIKPGNTLGQTIKRYMERSGVPQVNKHRKDAYAELYRQYNSNPAKSPERFENRGEQLGDAIVTETIFVFYVTLPPGCVSEWGIFRDGEVVSQSPLPSEGMKRLPDLIVAALSEQAYGASEPDLPSASVGRSYEDVRLTETEFRKIEGKQVYTASSVPPQPRGPVSDWTRSQTGADPTGNEAVAVVLGYSPNSSREQELTTYGVLTSTEASVFARVQSGMSQREVAQFLQVDPSTVSRVYRHAKNKLAQSPVVGAIIRLPDSP